MAYNKYRICPIKDLLQVWALGKYVIKLLYLFIHIFILEPVSASWSKGGVYNNILIRLHDLNYTYLFKCKTNLSSIIYLFSKYLKNTEERTKRELSDNISVSDLFHHFLSIPLGYWLLLINYHSGLCLFSHFKILSTCNKF